MKYFSSVCLALAFLFLLSCDQSDGDSPTPSQKSKVFVNEESAKIFSAMTERFKEFLNAESANTFSDINSGYSFDKDGLSCSASSSISINGSSLSQLSSNNCYYYYNEEDNFEGFSITSSYALNQNFRFIVFVHFANMGIPQTGTYSYQLICGDNYSYCYSTIFLGGYVVNPQNELVDYYYTDSPTVEVLNENGIVAATFDETFYFFDEYYSELIPAFDTSGTVSCCN